jgi:hypothetical protein
VEMRGRARFVKLKPLAPAPRGRRAPEDADWTTRTGDAD